MNNQIDLIIYVIILIILFINILLFNKKILVIDLNYWFLSQ